MAELLIVVVAVAVLLLYAADRARKLRARARQMAGMNERLDVAAAKVDQEQQQKRAVVRASAELTSVLPAIKRPPLTLPGVPGPAGEPDEEAAPDGGPAGPAAAENVPASRGTAPEPAGGTAADLPALKLRVTSERTLIMPAVPDQGRAPTGEAAPPDTMRDRAAARQERADR